MLLFGKSIQGRTLTVNSRAFGVLSRDLGVQVHGSLKVAPQVDRMMKLAFGMSAFISQGIEFRSWDIMIPLYKT